VTKPFASSADLEAKRESLEVIAEGVYALTAEGDPNVGAIEAEDFVVCFEARATPTAARNWLRMLRQFTDKPVRYLVLTHYHAVRVLGASAFEGAVVVASRATHRLIAERGLQDWASEYGRMPRLFADPDSIPGLTWPDIAFDNRLDIDLGPRRGRLELHFCGRGHTAGDIVGWYPEAKTLFAGDLVESQAALYTGDAFHTDWMTGTLDRLKEFPTEHLVGGRGTVVHGPAACNAAIEQTRDFLQVTLREVREVHRQRGTIQHAFHAVQRALGPRYGHWPIFEHCLPFNVQRVWDELDGIDWPRIWTADRDREVWASLQS